ncbi:hypothetical protein [Tellurirhabdus rosea]|uniref:hypothetical protein n=1 Tax=Tellurirhabdus rosea TaxID=2674997 RepID=UPI00225B817D|nr:hypothetical protein [Tellurirhabdus rosea]
MRGIAYFLVFLLILAGIFYLLTGWSYSDGERAGTISKFSRRGYLFKTYEGVLNVGGFSGETGSLTPQYFDFSVKNDSVANRINQAIRSGQRVTLHYEEKIFKLPWNGETKYFVTSVDLVDTPNRYGYPGQSYPQPTPQPLPQDNEQTQPAQPIQPQDGAVYDSTNAL